MTRLEVMAHIKRLGEQRKQLVARWRQLKRPDHEIAQGEIDIEAFRQAWKWLAADQEGEMNGQDRQNA